MNDISEAERLALITHDQVRLVLQEAELVELATLEAEERPAIQTHRAKPSILLQKSKFERPQNIRESRFLDATTAA